MVPRQRPGSDKGVIFPRNGKSVTANVLKGGQGKRCAALTFQVGLDTRGVKFFAWARVVGCLGSPGANDPTHIHVAGP